MIQYDPTFTKHDRGYVYCVECGAQTESWKARYHPPRKIAAEVILCTVPQRSQRDDYFGLENWVVHVFGPTQVERLVRVVVNRPQIYQEERKWFGISYEMIRLYDPRLIKTKSGDQLIMFEAL